MHGMTDCMSPPVNFKYIQLSAGKSELKQNVAFIGSIGRVLVGSVKPHLGGSIPSAPTIMIARITASRKARSFSFLYWKTMDDYREENKDLIREVFAPTIGEACKKMVRHIKKLKNSEDYVIDYEVMLPDGDYSNIHNVKVMGPYIL